VITMTDCRKEDIEDIIETTDTTSLIAPKIVVASPPTIETVNINFNNKPAIDHFKFETINPLGHRVVLKESTWNEHVIKDHPDRIFYNDEFNFGQIVSVIATPTLIVEDKDFSDSNVRLNYLGSAMIKNNGQFKMKSVKIVTEVNNPEISIDIKDRSTWNYQEMVTCFVQSTVSEDFMSREVHYVQNSL